MEQGKERIKERRIFEAATQAGEILLSNGAEIARVEETMERMVRHFGIQSAKFVVLGNAIFATGGKEDGSEQYAKVEHIPVRSTNFEKVIAINQLSREIEKNAYTLEQVEAEIARIRRLKGRPLWMRALACGFGSAFFCGLLGGSWLDSLAGFFVSVLIYLFMAKVTGPHMSKAIGNLLASALATLLCLLCHRIGFGDDLSHMVVGGIIPLVPGIALTNGVRDLTEEDYLSGTVRMLDAVLVFVCIAIGVGATLMLFQYVLGGLAL